MKVKAVVIVMLMIAFLISSTIGVPIKPESGLRGTRILAESDIPYNYQVVNGTFASNDTLTDMGVRIENVDTDWGLVGFDKGDYAGKTFSQLSWGEAGIPCHVRYYDLKMDYWFYNGSGHAGRPFAADWGNFFLLRNDSYALVIQYYAQTGDAYSGTDDVWNATVRFTVLKAEPYIKIDLWIRYLNESALIKKMDIKPCLYDGGVDYTSGRDLSRQMAYRLAIDESYAVGHVGKWAQATYGNVYSTFGQFTQNGTQMNLSRDWHTSSVIIVGQNLSDLENKSDRLGSEWFTAYDSTDTNLVVAYNDDRIDCFRFYPATGYTYVPSGIVESVVVENALTEHTFRANPLVSYSKIPVVTNIDDHYQAFGLSAPWTWYYAQSEAYGIATTFPTQWYSVTAPAMDDMITLADMRESTLNELGDHGWNHTSWYSYPDYDYQYNLWELSEAKWEDASSYDLLSIAFPGNAWSNSTFAALGNGGCINIRGSILGNEFFAPYDFNYGTGTVFVAGFTNLYTNGEPSDYSIRFGNTNGYLFMQGHIADFDTDPEKADVIAWWEYLADNSDLFTSVTHSQWSDLWHYRIACYDDNDKFTIDMTNATVNHRLEVGPTDGLLPLFWDITTDEPVTVESVDTSELVFYAKKGHVYQEVPIRMSVNTGNMTTMALIEWNADTYRTSWIVEGETDTNVTWVCTFAPNTRYDIFIDGVLSESVTSDQYGIFQIDYSGVWSTHRFVIEVGSIPSVNIMASFEYTIEGDKVTFTDKSYGGAVVWVWNFGDGYGSTTQNPTHVYIKSGTFTVSLTVYDSEAKSSKAQTTIEILLDSDNPIDRDDEGWNVFISDTMTLTISAMGLIFGGAILIMSGVFFKRLPILTQKGRKVLGVMMLGSGLGYYLFLNTSWMTW